MKKADSKKDIVRDKNHSATGNLPEGEQNTQYLILKIKGKNIIRTKHYN